MTVHIYDTVGLMARTTSTVAEKAVARGELARTDDPRIFKLRDDAERLLVTPGLTPTQARRRFLAEQGKRARR